MGLSGMILGLVLLGVVLWWLLDRHENRRAAAGEQRRSGLRLAFAAAALLTMLFAGGCSLLFGINADGQYVTPETVLILVAGHAKGPRARCLEARPEQLERAMPPMIL